MVFSARSKRCAMLVAFFSPMMAVNSTSRTSIGHPCDDEDERHDKQAQHDVGDVAAQDQPDRDRRDDCQRKIATMRGSRSCGRRP